MATGALSRPRSRSDRNYLSASPDAASDDRAAAGSRGHADGGAPARAAGAHVVIDRAKFAELAARFDVPTVVSGSVFARRETIHLRQYHYPSEAQR